MYTVIKTIATRKCCWFCKNSRMFNIINTHYITNAIQCDGCRRIVSFSYDKFSKEHHPMSSHSNIMSIDIEAPKQASGENKAIDVTDNLK